MFGTANQLLAVLALCIGTTIIFRVAPKKSYALVTFVPMVFLAVTVLVAGTMNIGVYMKDNSYLNIFLSVVLITLTVVILIDNFRLWMKLLKKDKPTGMNDGREVIYYQETNMK